jgi:hypothetical protein
MKVNSHPEAADFEAYVIGALENEARHAFLAHVSECEACAATLQREARVELAMFEVHEAARKNELEKGSPQANRGARVLTLRPKRRTMTLAIGALAAAAAIFFFHRIRKSPAPSNGPPMTMTVTAPRETTPIPPVTCPDGMDQERCVEDAHRHGLFVAYPPWAAAPPLGGGSGRGPNGPPFGDGQM